MNILGVGSAEFVSILIIMLIFAGPKRMAQWAYILGQYTARLRQMWAETMGMIEDELKESGVDVKLPKQPPTRGELNRQLGGVMEKIAAPVQETLEQVDSEVSDVQQRMTVNTENGSKNETVKADPKPQDDSRSDFGTWSNQQASDE